VDTEENGKINNIVQTFELYFSLNRVSIPTRYPDDLQRILKDYNKKERKIVYGGKHL